MRTPKLVLAALLACTAAALAVDLTLKWDAPPGAEYWIAETTNGEPVHLEYLVSRATNAAGPFAIVAVTTNTQTRLTNQPAPVFYYVRASNVFGVSEPSNFVSVPNLSNRIEGTTLVLP